MQIIDNPNQLAPLLVLIPLHFAKASSTHLILFASLILIRPYPTQNYCNAAFSVIITILLILKNFH